MNKSISQLIFEKRLLISTRLIGLMNSELKALREYNLDILHHDVMGIDLNSDIVQSNRDIVEYFRDREAWEKFSKKKLFELLTHVSPLPTKSFAFDQFDKGTETEKHFDNMMLGMQLEYVQTNVLPEKYRLILVDVAKELKDRAIVLEIRAKIDLVDKMLTNEFWQYISLTELEYLRCNLRSIVHFLNIKVENIAKHRKNNLCTINTNESILFQLFQKLKEFFESCKTIFNV